MTTKKTTEKSKASAKISAKAPAQKKAMSPSKPTTATRAPAGKHAVDALDQEPGHGRTVDPSDAARDKRVRNDLEEDSRRSAGDRHRERLTAVDAQEDGVLDDDDEDDDEKAQRELALGQVDADEDRTDRPMTP